MERVLNVRPAVQPDVRLTEAEWFLRFNVSSHVTFKKLGKQDNHVFDVVKFKERQSPRKSWIRIINRIVNF